MNRTKIEYLEKTWNPTVGCTGEGCAIREHCWARWQSKRMKHKCQNCYDFTPHLHPERLGQPMRLRKPARIGVCFMGDLFDFGAVPFNEGVLKIIRATPRHTFVLLTKQAQNLIWHHYPENVWLGVTINKREDLWRLSYLLRTDAKVKFISFEPLLEDISNINLSKVNWIIIGAQQRPDFQPEDKWVTNLMSIAKVHGIPVFLKDNLFKKSGLWLHPKEYPK